MALVISSKRCMRKTFPWFGAILNAKRSRAPLQRLEVLEVIRPTPRSRPPLSESAKPKLMHPQPQQMSQPPQALLAQMPRTLMPQPHHFWYPNHQHPKQEHDHSWSLRHRPLQKQQPQESLRRLQAPVARMPLGVGIVITMVHAENGVSGVGLGITVTRPAAVGSFGTVRETMIFFCSIAQDVAW